MKRILITALLFLFASLSVSASSLQTPRGFAGKLWAGTLALYGTRHGQTHFLCTTEPFEQISGGYHLMSAGHCVQDTPADLQFSVSDEIGGTRTPVTMIKAYEGDGLDFSEFELKTDRRYPVMDLGDESDLAVGDSVINPNFSSGLAKQLSVGFVSSNILIETTNCSLDDCAGRFIVQLTAAPGASGSAIVSARTHKIVGLLVFEFEDGVGFGVEPISRFKKFLAGPNQPHSEDTKSTDSSALTIAPEEFVKLFGEAHPFHLAMLGPDGTFMQAGYKFDTGLAGLALSDKLYYDVPVFIGVDERGYFLVSTAEGNPSIFLHVVAVP